MVTSGPPRLLADFRRSAALRPEWRHVALWAIGVHALLWMALPSLFVHGMHADTMELIYWSREFRLAYPKHPPLASWLLGLVFVPGRWPIQTLLLFAQVCVSLTAVYVWRTCRLFADDRTAFLAVAFYLASPAASALGVQVNHNSVLAPFWGASLFYGLRVSAGGGRRDMTAFAAAAGLGFLTKYEIVLLLVPLAAAYLLGPCAPRQRRPSDILLGLAIFGAVTGPTLWQVLARDAASLTYAVSARRIEAVANVAASARDFVLGHLEALLGAILTLGATWRCPWPPPERPDGATLWRVGCLGLAPSICLALGSVLTLQDVRQGWLLPMTSNLSVAAAILCRNLDLRLPRPVRALLLVAGLAGLNLCAFAGFAAFRGVVGKPLKAFDVDAALLAQRVEERWLRHERGPLRCVIVDGRDAAAALLWLASGPKVVNLADPGWSMPDQVTSCRQYGGVAILREASEDGAATRFRIVNEDEWRAPSVLVPGTKHPRVDLFYVPPGASPGPETVGDVSAAPNPDRQAPP